MLNVERGLERTCWPLTGRTCLVAGTWVHTEESQADGAGGCTEEHSPFPMGAGVPAALREASLSSAFAFVLFLLRGNVLLLFL